MVFSTQIEENDKGSSNKNDYFFAVEYNLSCTETRIHYQGNEKLLKQIIQPNPRLIRVAERPFALQRYGHGQLRQECLRDAILNAGDDL